MIGLIFASGSLKQTQRLSTLIDQADLIVAADGGANHCALMGIKPDMLVGDFDSIDQAILTKFQQENVEIHQHPVSKDATDLELALDLAIEKGASSIWLLGVLGGRWDMSLSNIMLGASDKYTQQDIVLLAEDCVMYILRPQKTHTIQGDSGQTVSLLALGGDVEGVHLDGFEYQLVNQTINSGSSLGLSNVLTGEQATISFKKGILLCIQLLSAPL